MPKYWENMTIKDARISLRAAARLEGEHCPVCGQFAKVYKRKIYATMARDMILLWQKSGTDWAYLPDVVPERGGNLVKMRYWGFLEKRTNEDGSAKVGWWRVTEKGEAWIRGETTVPKFALIYNGKCLGLLPGPQSDSVSVTDALAARFSYKALMEDHVDSR